MTYDPPEAGARAHRLEPWFGDLKPRPLLRLEPRPEGWSQGLGDGARVWVMRPGPG